MDDFSDPYAEIERLLSAATGRSITRERWSNVYNMFKRGVNLKSIAEHYDRHPSTIIRLIKRAALEEQKNPGFIWPRSRENRPVCDIATPMPDTKDPRDWHHVRLQRRRDFRVGFCPVCRQGGILVGGPIEQGKTLMEIFCSKTGEPER